MDIYNNDGWFFSDPLKNNIHIISKEDINLLFQLANNEDAWINNILRQVDYFDKNPESDDWVLNEFRIINAPGTVFRYPFDLSTITFPSRRHLFRGEPNVYEKTIPSFNRKHSENKVLWKALADMRISQFMKFILKFNVVPYWEAKISDIFIKALAQHYGFETCLLDLTNDVRTALFFATCVYVQETDSYRPMNEKECKERKYGVLFHTPDWRVDFFGGCSYERINQKFGSDINRIFKLDNGDLDGIAFQIGLQPLLRCHYQSGYVYPMYDYCPLQENWEFEKLYIPLTVEFSNFMFNMMNGGKKVFPNEGINEARHLIDKIKCSTVFSDNDLIYAFNEQSAYKSLDFFKNDIQSFSFDNDKILIQKKEIDYYIEPELLKLINDKYDNKPLLEATRGMYHVKADEQRYRRQA